MGLLDGDQQELVELVELVELAESEGAVDTR